MPRAARMKSPTDYYHIMVRGINKERIFADQAHKKFILELLKSNLSENKISVAAYCIMDNHLHLVLKGELEDISIALKKVNIKFAMKLNKEQDRVGHVFQDRYKSEIINNDQHLLQAIRYVHNNPVKAGIENDPKKYQWSSYSSYTGKDLTILDKGIKGDIIEIAGGIRSFMDFHGYEDLNEFIDTQEEIENNRQELAQSTINDYFKEKGILEIGYGEGRSEHERELVKRLLTNTKLSHRKIARLLEIDKNKVHSISRGMNTA
ncbi:REP-associated tyrosine transposase [Gudongella sp. DL1XJH-153]|uniref:REP-associated tyrosine transposase n=1 Tax=Gudongella sp. DL1XJH-153 TaxID=3409804 RepID=UPI003BB4A362